MKLVIHVDSPSVRGNEMQVHLLARTLTARGHEVVFSCPPRGPVEALFQGDGFRTTSVRPRGDLDLYSALRFATWLRRERADALLNTSWKKVLVAGWAARVAGVPRVVLRLGGVHSLRKGMVGRTKYRVALERCYDMVIVNSSIVEEHLIGLFPALASSRRVARVENGIEISAPLRGVLREELGLGAEDILLISVGGLEHRKGFDVLIRSLSHLPDQIHLAIAGAGAEQAKLEDLRASLGLEERVHFLGHRSDAPALISASDIFVLSSRGEGMAHAMLEALVARTPVIATKVGGVAEALEPRDGRRSAGWTVPREDDMTLAATISEVVSLRADDPGEIEARGREGVWRLENWLSVERMATGYERILNVESPRTLST